MASPQGKKLAMGLFFLAPNILGFMTFTLFPLIFSLILAFTNWDLSLHNMFKTEHPRFLGFENFTTLWNEPDFWRYLGNTLFLMMSIPFSIGGSLMAAILLSQDLRGGSRHTWAWIMFGAIFVASITMLAMLGAGATAMTLLIVGAAATILVIGSIGGNTVYRTLFFTPHFTSGVATYILWKKLYNPQTGPINYSIQPVLDHLASLVKVTPPPLITSLAWLCVSFAAVLLFIGIRRLRADWRDGEAGWGAIVAGIILLLLPIVFVAIQLPVLAHLRPTKLKIFTSGLWLMPQPMAVLLLIAAVFALMLLLRSIVKKRPFICGAQEGLGQALMLGGVLMVGQIVLIGMVQVFLQLPAAAKAGVDAPQWLTSYSWAKPSLMVMGFWAAVGSNNMLLYLAGLSNVPQELYEAAEIDGASRFQRFWNVTWPQLAPVTFFIVVMSIIGGLQGGFEMARSMTNGGPAGSTTTLSYYVYNEGFGTGRLGYASAIAWALFVLVFSVTIFNWKFGNRYVND